jgi:hypothetical protein
MSNYKINLLKRWLELNTIEGKRLAKDIINGYRGHVTTREGNQVTYSKLRIIFEKN